MDINKIIDGINSKDLAILDEYGYDAIVKALNESGREDAGVLVDALNSFRNDELQKMGDLSEIIKKEADLLQLDSNNVEFYTEGKGGSVSYEFRELGHKFRKIKFIENGEEVSDLTERRKILNSIVESAKINVEINLHKMYEGSEAFFYLTPTAQAEIYRKTLAEELNKSLVGMLVGKEVEYPDEATRNDPEAKQAFHAKLSEKVKKGFEQFEKLGTDLTEKISVDVNNVIASAALTTVKAEKWIDNLKKRLSVEAFESSRLAENIGKKIAKFDETCVGLWENRYKIAKSVGQTLNDNKYRYGAKLLVGAVSVSAGPVGIAVYGAYMAAEGVLWEIDTQIKKRKRQGETNVTVRDVINDKKYQRKAVMNVVAGVLTGGLGAGVSAAVEGFANSSAIIGATRSAVAGGVGYASGVVEERYAETEEEKKAAKRMKWGAVAAFAGSSLVRHWNDIFGNTPVTPVTDGSSVTDTTKASLTDTTKTSLNLTNTSQEVGDTLKTDINVEPENKTAGNTNNGVAGKTVQTSTNKADLTFYHDNEEVIAKRSFLSVRKLLGENMGKGNLTADAHSLVDSPANVALAEYMGIPKEQLAHIALLERVNGRSELLKVITDCSPEMSMEEQFALANKSGEIYNFDTEKGKYGDWEGPKKDCVISSVYDYGCDKEGKLDIRNNCENIQETQQEAPKKTEEVITKVEEKPVEKETPQPAPVEEKQEVTKTEPEPVNNVEEKKDEVVADVPVDEGWFMYNPNDPAQADIEIPKNFNKTTDGDAFYNMTLQTAKTTGVMFRWVPTPIEGPFGREQIVNVPYARRLTDEELALLRADKSIDAGQNTQDLQQFIDGKSR